MSAKRKLTLALLLGLFTISAAFGKAPLSTDPARSLGGSPGTCIQNCTITFNACVQCGYTVYECQPVYNQCYSHCILSGYPLDYVCDEHL
jgi:hypothetical protein